MFATKTANVTAGLKHMSDATIDPTGALDPPMTSNPTVRASMKVPMNSITILPLFNWPWLAASSRGSRTKTVSDSDPVVTAKVAP